VNGNTVKLGEKIDSGGEGGVYHIKNSQDSVVKVLNSDIRSDKEQKVEAMIANPPVDPTLQKKGVRSIIWPTAVVEDNSGTFVGYQMPYKDLDEAQNVWEYAMMELSWADSSATGRYTIARNLAIMIYSIHRQDHAVGDFNHDNILIGNGFISLIDCDGFHITDNTGKTYGGETYFPRYAPPEGRGEELEEVQEADRFSLGVHIFQLLMEGHHPYQAEGPEAASGTLEDMIRENKYPFEYDGYEPHSRALGYNEYNQLPAGVRDLFRKCFSEHAKDIDKADLLYGGGRPDPSEWIDALGKAIGDSVSIRNSGSKGDSGGGNGSTRNPYPGTDSTGGGNEENSDDEGLNNPYDGADETETDQDSDDALIDPYRESNSPDAGTETSDDELENPYDGSSSPNAESDNNDDTSDDDDELADPYDGSS
jgi:DNA-binding helix-hairpin-helix protein with protein kinase domain